MEITYITLAGMKKTQTFASAGEFVMLQSREIPALDDSNKVLSVEIDGKEFPFTGNIADLFFKLNGK